jgi:hypothetical protein
MQVLDGAVDDAVLARGVAAFEQGQDLEALFDPPGLGLDQGDLQPLQRVVVVVGLGHRAQVGQAEAIGEGGRDPALARARAAV